MGKEKKASILYNKCWKYTAVTIYYISLHVTICIDSASQRVLAANWIFLLSYPGHVNKTQTAIGPGESMKKKTNRSNW